MIKTIVFGLACFAAIGVIAVGAETPAHDISKDELIFPIVVGAKSDRLDLSTNDTLTVVDKVEPSTLERSPAIQPALVETIETPAPDIVPRHWHDPHDRKPTAAKRKARATKEPRGGSPSNASTNLADACRTDGLDPLLRKLNLSPQC